jgi:hypothetical protein
MGPDRSRPEAQRPVLCDVVNRIVIDAQIEPLSAGERALGIRHSTRLSEISGVVNPLILADRGYPSAEFIQDMIDRKFKFLLRVKSKFNVEIDRRNESGGIVEIKRKGFETIKVRVIKVEIEETTKDGTEIYIETLITNLFDKELTPEVFKELYNKRWGIETEYDLLKNKMEIENFSGIKLHSIKQDFFKCMINANVSSLVCWDKQEGLEKAQLGKRAMHLYKANMNEVIGKVKLFCHACFCAAPADSRGSWRR